MRITTILWYMLSAEQEAITTKKANVHSSKKLAQQSRIALAEHVPYSLHNWAITNPQ